MKQSEKGFTLIELIGAIAVMALIALAVTAVTFQVLKVAGQSNDQMTAIPQVQNAGYWISLDTQMAESIFVDNLEPPNFIILNWTEHDYEGGDPTYHWVTYFFEDLSDGIGKLKRNHRSSAGADDETLIAQHIYYDPDDPDNSSIATCDSPPELTVRLRALFGHASVTREYKAVCRPNL